MESEKEKDKDTFVRIIKNKDGEYLIIPKAGNTHSCFVRFKDKGAANQKKRKINEAFDIAIKRILLEKEEWACFTCGHVGNDFLDEVSHTDLGDEPYTKCPECGSDYVSEVGEAYAQVFDQLEDLKKKTDRAKNILMKYAQWSVRSKDKDSLEILRVSDIEKAKESAAYHNKNLNGNNLFYEVVPANVEANFLLEVGHVRI
jgi:predicted RNA-binding protein YlxR (DUF448 family)